MTIRLVANGKTTDEVQSNKDGQFAFERVTPGEYKLTGEGLIAGNRRSAEIALTVPPAPKQVDPVELILESAR